MKTKTAKRRTEIIRELSRLSHNGWKNAMPCDYQPLERELDALQNRKESRHAKN